VVLTPETRKQARDFIGAVRVSGGTNIHDAVVEALRQKPLDGMLPLVLFLTDGLPTVGQTSEKSIREAAAAGNPHKRRIFSFGVGFDVNTPLLSRLAREARGAASFVLPNEDVEVKVGAVYKRLAGPVLAAPELKVVDSNGGPVPGRIMDMLPSLLPDIFDGDQLILLGRYQGEQPLRFLLTGDSPGGKRTFTFDFQLDKATTANAFVPRLWAGNKIAVLSEAIRDLGADMPLGATSVPPQADPRMKELVAEIVRLSTQFGILTEYTAFLATETAPLASAGRITEETYRRFESRALPERAGAAGANQEMNFARAKEKKFSNNRDDNYYYDMEMKKVEVAKVQQITDKGYFQRGNRWVESTAATAAPAADGSDAVDASVAIGSPEFDKLVDELAEDNRQSVLALRGEILLVHRGKRILIK
jgi:Ca-activated chloride channel family protein